jgi:RimJ/RimL family protein N-acetyltransferase
MSERVLPTEASPHGLTALPFSAVSITTQRLCLRPLRRSDLNDAHEGQRRADAASYLNWEVRDHDQSGRHLEKRRAMPRLAKDGDGLVFALELPDPTGGHGRVLGDMSLFLKSAADAQLEIGWVIHPAAHGHGFGAEAAIALLGLCFETLGAHRVFAELDPRNDASARLCTRLGMRKEAHLVQNQIIKGEWTDTACYAILASEWAARTP